MNTILLEQASRCCQQERPVFYGVRACGVRVARKIQMGGF
jgi:hypothetical protein